ncbi:MAG TPA: hypothetical protein PLZ95_03625 [Bryobacteraceae bacterium]|nr:hypothetical protein [Bryobacteraceae bacterium]
MSDLKQPSKSGVDATLVAWMLSKTPAGRLATLEEYIEDIEILRNARKIPSEYRGPGAA